MVSGEVLMRSSNLGESLSLNFLSVIAGINCLPAKKGMNKQQPISPGLGIFLGESISHPYPHDISRDITGIVNMLQRI